MSMPGRPVKSRWPTIAGLFTPLTAALVGAALSPPAPAMPSYSAPVLSCRSTVRVENPSIAISVASAIRARGVNCRRAKRVIHAFFQAKLTESLRRCAQPAENPPFTGCTVDGLLCRRLAGSVSKHVCRTGGELVSFRERDVPLGQRHAAACGCLAPGRGPRRATRSKPAPR